MKIFVLFVCVLFSTSVFAASYATCSANDYSNNKQISLKLTWNKVFLNENNQGLEEWLIEKYTKEEHKNEEELGLFNYHPGDVIV